MNSWSDEVRQAARSLARSPGVAAVALLSLALGVGVNLAIAHAARAVLERRPPGREPERVVGLSMTTERRPGALLPFSYPNYEDLRDRLAAFEDLALGTYVGASLAEPGDPPEQLGGVVVTANYFEVLGIEAEHGRTFTPEEGVEDRPVVVLSHRFWQRRFGGDTGVIGRSLRINRRPFTVVGIAPEGFDGTLVLATMDFWAPLGARRTFLTGDRERFFASRRALMFPVCLGRLGPGVSLESARAETAALAVALAAEHPDDNTGRGFALTSLAEAMIQPDRRAALQRGAAVLKVLAATLLLLACANVANLLWTRLADREAELSLRLALGAGRGALFRLPLTEAFALAVAGGALGLAVAWWLRGVLWSLRPPLLDQAAIDLSFDARALGAAVLLPLVAGLASGLLPAVHAIRSEYAAAALGRPGGRATAGSARVRLGSAVVVGQVALATLALVGAGVLVASLRAAQRIDLGFDGSQVVLMNLDVGAEGYDPAQGESFFDQVLERTAAVPGVTTASLASALPLFAPTRVRTVFPGGRQGESDERGERVGFGVVATGYFKTLGIAILAGRDLAATDTATAPPVAVVDETLARTLWPEEGALDRSLEFLDQPGVHYRVVGVARAVRHDGLGEEPAAMVYLSHRQHYIDHLVLVASTAGEPGAMAETLRRALQPLDPGLPITNAQPMTRLVDEALAPPRALARLAGGFAVLSLALAATGVGGLLLYAVRRRQREIAVRRALGADRAGIVALVVRRALVLAGLGTAVGIALTVTLLRTFATPLGELLFDLRPVPWSALLGAAALLVAVAVLASLAAARRALAVDPLRLLREQ